MMQLDMFAAAPLARNSDPITSHMAAESARDLRARHHRIILRTLADRPLGKSGIAAKSELTEYQVSKRLCELERAGLIEPTGRIVPSASGRGEREWRKVQG